MRSKISPVRRRFGISAPILRISALIFFGIISIGPLSYSLMAANAAPAIDWNKQVDKSLEQAKTEHKYVLADVYTDWCSWCKRLDEQTFSDKDMAKFLSGKFVCIKVNAEDNAEGAKLASKYNVKGYPCALVFDQSGTYIGKISGFLPPADYQKKVTQLIENPPSVPEM